MQILDLVQFLSPFITQRLACRLQNSIQLLFRSIEHPHELEVLLCWWSSKQQWSLIIYISATLAEKEKEKEHSCWKRMSALFTWRSHLNNLILSLCGCFVCISVPLPHVLSPCVMSNDLCLYVRWLPRVYLKLLPRPVCGSSHPIQSFHLVFLLAFSHNSKKLLNVVSSSNHRSAVVDINRSTYIFIFFCTFLGRTCSKWNEIHLTLKPSFCIQHVCNGQL